jgi:hypothetical protein
MRINDPALPYTERLLGNLTAGVLTT